MGLASWRTHLPSKKILIWLPLSGERGAKITLAARQVCFGDGDGPRLGDAGWRRGTALYSVAFELHHCHTFHWLHCQKNWHQHIWGRYAWSKWGYDCEPCLSALSMFYLVCGTGFARWLVCVSQAKVDSYSTYWDVAVRKISNSMYAGHISHH